MDTWLPWAIFKMSDMESRLKPKLGISLTQLLLTQLQNLRSLPIMAVNYGTDK